MYLIYLADDQSALLAKPNGLEELYDYFIKEKYGDPLPFDTKSKVGLFLEGLDGTGGANPIYIGVTEHLGLAASNAIGSLPTYSTAVLCAFYGTAIFNQIYAEQYQP